ncbi:MAG: 16S rRNA (cytidine(1402)-2'-O)-methyltransferase [Lachnospiraceae bacterium]|nr:16S rRNA (cytidine(1402)-2'-O)-methyltransferase [Lachnospiraceae bacterium]
MEKGKLYLCATPIGNLNDMTPRCVEILRTVDLIAAEDTRNSIKLLNHFGIHTPMTAYHEFNRFDKADELVEKILGGMNVACITDAGTPGISDPGEVLVQKAAEEGIEVFSIPGACAAISALVISGLSTRRFRFEAFLPMQKKERKAVLDVLKDEEATIVLYEAPHKLLRTLNDLKDAGLGTRRIALCKELTKVHEKVFRTTIEEALAYYEKNEPKGEYVLVMEGADPNEKLLKEQESWEKLAIGEHVALYEKQGMDRKDAIKAAAKDRGLSKREVYNAVIADEA